MLKFVADIAPDLFVSLKWKIKWNTLQRLQSEIVRVFHTVISVAYFGKCINYVGIFYLQKLHIVYITSVKKRNVPFSEYFILKIIL